MKRFCIIGFDTKALSFYAGNGYASPDRDTIENLLKLADPPPTGHKYIIIEFDDGEDGT